MNHAADDHPPPDDLRELDNLLRQVRFEPRGSFHPELLGRLNRREQPAPRSRKSVVRRFWPVMLPAGLTVALGLILMLPERRVTIDRCCYDLDGGGTTDDGALIVAERNGRVYRLLVYEDSDGSGTLTPADVVRFERAGMSSLEKTIPAGLTKIQHCCQDLDGGGPPDDGLLVVATPPDRVHTAAIYELR